MDRMLLAVPLAAAVSVVAAAVLSLRYQEAGLVFALVAAASAPVVIHRIGPPVLAGAALLLLALYASFPVKKLWGVWPTYGAFGEIAVTLCFLAVLFLVGGGWRRDWTGRGPRGPQS